ncbi:MAG: oxidoreductase [Flaviflexus sp.]|uniref:Oxidoreductase n=1 Tax=Flaviflexus ciconiae TaxID=2496867 RepID=A0A3S9PVG1_9ACTO|nr:oxidoreductase [Flaviflexus ciconiae]AZQ76337.1 oxidoreductase [Flaviflexus ciconiae]
MGIFSRLGGGGSRERRNATRDHFQDFVATRKGVEAYLEPAGAREPLALILVARDGEWTRRQVPSPKEAANLATELGLPFYEIIRTGYPQRMREWSRKNK